MNIQIFGMKNYYDIASKRGKFEACQSVDDFIHQKLLSLFFIYLIVGGMPDAVKKYIETKDIREVDKIQKDIVELYKEDL